MEVARHICLIATIFVASTLASGAGTGGGALYVPAFAVFLNDIHKAVPLSKVTIFGGCLVSVFFNIRRRHPKTKAPLISYELAALLEPFTLLGGIIGVLLNVVMTDAQILACLVITLSFTSYKTFKKGLAQRAEETRLLYKQNLSSVDGLLEAAGDSLRGSERESLLEGGSRDAPSSESGGRASPVQDTTFFAATERLLDIQDSVAVDLTPGPLKDSRCVGTCFLSVAFLVSDSLLNVILLTAAGGPVALLCGEPQEQAALFLLVSIHVLGSFLYGRWLLGVQKRCKESGMPSPLETPLSPATAFLYPVLSLVAGVLAGSIGIGGGLIKGPLLLEIGLSPMAAISTANFMIFFTSSANTLQYAILGRLEWTESLCFLFTAGVAGGVGLLCIYQFMKRTHRQSHLTFFLAFVTLLSLLSMAGSFAHTHYWRSQTGSAATTSVQDVCRSHRGRLLFTHVG